MLTLTMLTLTMLTLTTLTAPPGRLRLTISARLPGPQWSGACGPEPGDVG